MTNDIIINIPCDIIINIAGKEFTIPRGYTEFFSLTKHISFKLGRDENTYEYVGRFYWTYNRHKHFHQITIHHHCDKYKIKAPVFYKAYMNSFNLLMDVPDHIKSSMIEEVIDPKILILL